MPLTPFHLGPGLLMKSVTPRRFSFLAFSLPQFLIDIEAVIAIAFEFSELHGPVHSYLGSFLIVPVAAEFSHAVYRFLNREHKRNVLYLSSFLGSIMHIVLDSVMHSDMRPYRPFSSSNHMLDFVSVSSLHGFCLATCLMGLLILSIRRSRLDLTRSTSDELFDRTQESQE